MEDSLLRDFTVRLDKEEVHTREDKQIRSGTSSQTDARSTTARGY